VRGPLGAAAILVSALLAACGSSQSSAPTCERPVGSLTILIAQSVPSATELPCIRGFPAGWGFGGSDVRSGTARFWLNSDRGGLRAVEVDLSSSCSTTGAAPVRPSRDEAGVRAFEESLSPPPRLSANRFLVFPGGCVTHRYRFEGGASASLAREAEEALSLVPRSIVVSQVHSEFGLTLCGVGAPPCPARTPSPG
jgi:hypothetical protein